MSDYWPLIPNSGPPPPGTEVTPLRPSLHMMVEFPTANNVDLQTYVDHLLVKFGIRFTEVDKWHVTSYGNGDYNPRRELRVKMQDGTRYTFYGTFQIYGIERRIQWSLEEIIKVEQSNVFY